MNILQSRVHISVKCNLRKYSY